MSSTQRLSDFLLEGSKFKVEPHPASAEGRAAARYWLTEVSDATRDLADQPVSHEVFELARVGDDYVRLTQESATGEVGHPPIILPLIACAFINV